MTSLRHFSAPCGGFWSEDPILNNASTFEQNKKKTLIVGKNDDVPYFYQSKIVAFHKLVMRYLLGFHLTGKFIRTEFGLTVPDVQR